MFIYIFLFQTPIHRLVQVCLKYNFIHIPLSQKSGLFISYTHADMHRIKLFGPGHTPLKIRAFNSLSFWSIKWPNLRTPDLVRHDHKFSLCSRSTGPWRRSSSSARPWRVPTLTRPSCKPWERRQRPSRRLTRTWTSTR